MPTYSYKCTECDHAFDVVQSISDGALTACPACDGALRKVFGLTGVTFNGSGFYRTDSRAASTGGASKPASGSGSASAGGSASSSS